MSLPALLWWMLTSPQAHGDYYTWAAVALAHGALGLLLAAALSLTPLGPHRAPPLVALAYGIGWEGAQLAWFGGTLGDGIADWLAVILGAVLFAALWSRSRGWIAAALVGAGIGLRAGGRNRS